LSFSAVIFDLDGVVVNTVPLHFSAWKKMFSEYGKSFDFEDYKKKVDGIPRSDGARAILTDLSEEELLRAATKKQSYFLEELGKSEVPVYDTTVNFIKQLRSVERKIAIISSSKNCSMILKKAGLYPLIDVEVNGNDIKHGKPAPDVFLTASNQLGVEPRACIVVEDAVLGVKAAKSAGMFCIGIDRHGDPARLKEANIIVKDAAEIDLADLQKEYAAWTLIQ
jgi:beta-phosphoglucomutase